MSRGPGRWQRLLLDALDTAGDLTLVSVADAGLDALDRSMSDAEYRALNRAAWLLQRRGRIHVQHGPGVDWLGRSSTRLYAWTCRNCSQVGTPEHLPAQPCFWCKNLTVRVGGLASRTHAECLRCFSTRRRESRRRLEQVGS